MERKLASIRQIEEIRDINGANFYSSVSCRWIEMYYKFVIENAADDISLVEFFIETR